MAETPPATPPAEPTPAPDPKPAATPPAVASPPSDPNKDPDWLPGRLQRAEEQAVSKFMDEMGITDRDEAKALISAAREAKEKEKSTAEKLGQTSEQLNTYKTEAERLKAVTAEWAERQMIGLTETQQDAVKKLAGDDPAKQLEAITTLTPTWTSSAPAPDAPPKPVTPPGGTAPPADAPDETAPGSPPDHKAVYEELQKTNPFAAAQYLSEHVSEVFPQS